MTSLSLSVNNIEFDYSTMYIFLPILIFKRRSHAITEVVRHILNDSLTVIQGDSQRLKPASVQIAFVTLLLKKSLHQDYLLSVVVFSVCESFFQLFIYKVCFTISYLRLRLAFTDVQIKFFMEKVSVGNNIW